LTDPTIVTLTTIPPRFDALGPTLRSILAQDLPVDEVRLYIPRRFRRFPDWDGALPAVPEGVAIHRVSEDLGPATKVLPAVRELRGQAADILFCDDDRLYDPGWHGRLKAARAARPEACICQHGENFPDIADEVRPPDRLPRVERLHKDWRYRLLRAATLLRVKPNEYLNDGFVDYFAGYGGVMVRPEWLDDDAVFDIPGVLWTVDDPWLSGHLERRGIPIWLTRHRDAPVKRESSARHALHKMVEQGHGRVEADLAAIDHFRDVYGIWQPGGPLPRDNPRMTEPMRAMLRRAQERARAGGA
jgi:hypothetical protein